MRRKRSIEHLEDTVILAYLDGELSRAAKREATRHLQSCWRCRSAAAELEVLAQTAYSLLSDRDEPNAAQVGIAKASFLRRKAKIDADCSDGSGLRTFFLTHENFSCSRADWLRRAYSSHAI